MALYSNQFTVNIREIARIIFTDVHSFPDGVDKANFVAEIAMYPEALKGLADLIYRSLDEHKTNTEEAKNQAN